MYMYMTDLQHNELWHNGEHLQVYREVPEQLHHCKPLHQGQLMLAT